MRRPTRHWFHAVLRARDAADTARGDLDESAEASGRDALTGLPTRTRFLDRLDAAAATARRKQSVLVGTVGIAMFPEDATEPAQRIVCADQAVYDAKRLAHGSLEFRERFDDGSAQSRLDSD